MRLRVSERSSDGSASGMFSHSWPITAIRIRSFAVGLALFDAVSFFPAGPHLQEVLTKIEKNRTIKFFWQIINNNGNGKKNTCL